jgi:hypothetical protein
MNVVEMSFVFGFDDSHTVPNVRAASGLLSPAPAGAASHDSGARYPIQNRTSTLPAQTKNTA